MRNTCHIRSNSQGVLLELEQRVPLSGKALVVVLDVLAWLGFIGFLIYRPSELSGVLLALAIVFMLFLLFVIDRFTAWTLWGREWVQVRPHALTYWRSYGPLRGPRRTVPLRNVQIAHRWMKRFYGVPYGKFIITNNSATQHAQVAYESTILLPKPQIAAIEQRLNQLFWDTPLHEPKQVEREMFWN